MPKIKLITSAFSALMLTNIIATPANAGTYTYKNLQYGPPVVEINLSALNALRMAGSQHRFAANKIQAQPIMTPQIIDGPPIIQAQPIINYQQDAGYNPSFNAAPIQPIIAEPLNLGGPLGLPESPYLRAQAQPTQVAAPTPMPTPMPIPMPLPNPRPAAQAKTNTLVMQPILKGDPGTIPSKAPAIPAAMPLPVPTNYAQNNYNTGLPMQMGEIKPLPVPSNPITAPVDLPPVPMPAPMQQPTPLPVPNFNIANRNLPQENIAQPIMERVSPINNNGGNAKYYKKPTPPKVVQTAKIGEIKPLPYKIETKQVSLPTPKFKSSSIVKPIAQKEVKLPTLPVVKEDVDVKLVELPKLGAPKLTMPKFEENAFETTKPEVPKLEVPELKIASLEAPEKKEISIDSLPIPMFEATKKEVKPFAPMLDKDIKLSEAEVNPNNDIELKLAKLPTIPGATNPIKAPTIEINTPDIMPGISRIDIDSTMPSVKPVTAPKLALPTFSNNNAPLPKVDFGIETKAPELKIPSLSGNAETDLANIKAGNLASPLKLPAFGEEPVTEPALEPLTPAYNADKGDYIIKFVPAEIEYPLSQQASLDKVAEELKANPDKIANLHAYASGNEGQSSQARRTSLRRALSIRNYLLGKDIDPSRVTPRVYGNDSLASTPDKVEIHIE